MNKVLQTIAVISVVLGACGQAQPPAPAQPVEPTEAPKTIAPEIDTEMLVGAWVKMWNDYDLSQVEKLFATDDTLTYFSSEKQGLIKGIDAVLEHHKGFGFVPGGNARGTELWVEDLHTTKLPEGAVVGGTWFFKRPTGKVQRGPVTFVYAPKGNEYRLAHLHFANYEPARAKDAQAVSLLGEALHIPELDEKTRATHEQNLKEAKAKYDADPKDPDALIWYGRRIAYLGRYLEAIEVFTKGIELHPNDPRMYRHRGHRYISTRQLDRAIDDFSHAAYLIRGKKDRVEPDGLPNAKNIPTSTLNFNIYYHLGLAYYLSGKLEHALTAYKDCLKVSKNPDSLVATTHWLYMTLRLLKKDEEAKKALKRIKEKMKIIESFGYHKLTLFYQGVIDEKTLTQSSLSWIDDPAIKYGLGNWYLYNGDKQKAVDQFKSLLKESNWATFGHIAAEADLSRL